MSATIEQQARLVRIGNLTRVEGEGALHVRLEGDRVEEVRLDIFEPPRFFEAFLRGRHFTELPDLTARICGICPVAYQMSSVQAVERGLGIEVGPEVRMVRRLMYWGEYIESHALHIYLLNAPDFLGYESAISLAEDHREAVEQALRLKKIGNGMLDLLGGRASHPVSVCVGGFHRMPRRRDLLAKRDELRWALEASKATVELVSGFAFPDFETDYELVALARPDEYAVLDGRIVSSAGLDIDVSEFEAHFREEHVPHSTALHSVRIGPGTHYFVGPLARLALGRARLAPQAAAMANECGIAWPSRNPFHGIVARAIELVHACEESLAIIEEYREPASPRVAYETRAGEGCGASEAPRGVLYHRYRWNAAGLIEEAKITPPTAQNLGRMEEDLRLLIPSILERPEAEIAARCENLVRTYDPCISCSTHFLELHIAREEPGSSHEGGLGRN